MTQLDIYDCLAVVNSAVDDEAAYAHAEREGKRMNDRCPECPDPGLCDAQGECSA